MSGWVRPAEWDAPLEGGNRPGWVTTAGVVLLTFGVLSALAGLVYLAFSLAMGAFWGEMMRLQPGMPSGASLEAMESLMTGILVGISVVILVWASGHLAAGIGVLKGRSWARILGMVVSVLGAALSALGLAAVLWSFSFMGRMMDDPAYRDAMESYGYGTLPDDYMSAMLWLSVAFVVPFVVGYLVVIVALARNGRFFGRRAPVVAATPS